MEAIVLDDIPFAADVEALASKLRVRSEDDKSDLTRLIDEARQVTRPKAMYRLGFIEARDEDSVTIDGVRFTSRILRVNLDGAHRVFFYVATCGRELADWAGSLDDLLHQYWVEEIQVAALRCATQVLFREINERYQPGKTSAMAPGSLGEWPLTEQRPLFASLGDVKGRIGVRLSDSLLMVPAKSVSGIRFPTEASFESCQLCPRADCPNRRAPYDEGLYERKYRAAG